MVKVKNGNEEKSIRELPLFMKKEAIIVKGALYYSEGMGAWNLIRLGREFLNQLPKLRDKKAKFSYKMTHYFSHEELQNAIKDIKESGAPLPILLFLNEVKVDNY